MGSEGEVHRLVGRVVGAHGIRGEIVVHPLTNDPDRFFDLDLVFIVAKSPVQPETDSRSIEQVRIHKGRVLLKLEGTTTRNEAESLVGREVYIEATEQRRLEEGEFYIDSLVGLTVTDEAGTKVGRVASVEDIPGNPLVNLAVDGNGEVLVPFSKNYVSSVDLEGARLVLRETYRGLLNPVEA